MEENVQEKVDNTAQVKETAPAENDTSVNIANLRAAKVKAEKESAEFKSQLEEMQRQNVTPGPTEKEEEPESTYGDEDFVEGRHLRKELDSMKRKQQEFESRQREEIEADQLRRNFSDFSKVMTDANADKLKELDPETFMTIASSTASHYQRSVAAYKRIKELGIFVEDTHEQGRATAEANVNKPRPTNSVSPQSGDSPLSMANAFAGGLTDELKAQLWKEVQESAKRR